MRKVIITLFIFHFSFLIANAQWIQQNSGTTASLGNIKFINRYTGWVCGAGVILKTTNAGNNWISQNLPVNKSLNEIHPVDSNVIYCVGMFETIIKTTNGGVNWIVIRNGQPNSNTYFTCYFINQNTGWISGGAEQKILKTTNGGLSFDSIVRGTSGFVSDIYFRDSLNGLYCDDAGTVRKSTNGGYNWFTINIPVGYIIYTFRNFTFVNNQTGWIVTSSRKVFKTNDFGSNWDSVSNVPNGSYGISCIFFPSSNIGYAGGEGFDYNGIFKTTNGGVNWIAQYTPYPLNGAISMFFINDTNGWKVGNGGRICYTTNGGGIMQISKNNEMITNEFELFQNYPNPFNSSTTMEFEINKRGFYYLEIFDLLGRKVVGIFSKQLKEGKYKFTYNAEKLSSGTYFYRLQSNYNYKVKSFILLK
jgi:photosystem II stability/assembly factor-like uncharacterized protein